MHTTEQQLKQKKLIFFVFEKNQLFSCYFLHLKLNKKGFFYHRKFQTTN